MNKRRRKKRLALERAARLLKAERTLTRYLTSVDGLQKIAENVIENSRIEPELRMMRACMIPDHILAGDPPPPPRKLR